MAHMVSFIDVHKKTLAVVVGDAGKDEEVQFVRRKFGAGAGEVKACAEFLTKLARLSQFAGLARGKSFRISRGV